jgi:hypothetical protein
MPSLVAQRGDSEYRRGDNTMKTTTAVALLTGVVVTVGACKEPSTWEKRSECSQMADRIMHDNGYDKPSFEGQAWPHYNSERDRCFVLTSVAWVFSHHPWREIQLWDGHERTALATVNVYTEDRLEAGYMDSKHVGCVRASTFIAESMQDSPGVGRVQLCVDEGTPDGEGGRVR